MHITKPNPHPTQTAAPIHHLTAEALAHLLAALPALLPHAPPEWHRSRRKQITRQIAWLHPTDAFQAFLAGQIVVNQRLAHSAMRDACVRTHSPEHARRQGRMAAALMRSGDLLVHELRMQQKRPLPPAGAPTATNAPPPRTAPLRRKAVRPDPHRAPPPTPTQASPTARPARTRRPPHPATKPTGAAP
jgi:hypothetical protein